MEHQRQVSRLEINKFCESMGCDLVEVSVLQNIGIDELFDKVMDKCMNLQSYMEELEKNDPNKQDHK